VYRSQAATTKLHFWTLARGTGAGPIVTNPEQKFSAAKLKRDSVRISALESPGSKPAAALARGGSRVPCEIPIVLTSLDPGDPFSHACHIILANLRGCAVRSPHPVAIGTGVHLDGLPAGGPVAARVINCISLGEFEKMWLLSLALDAPGNVWGIEPVPEDWTQPL